MTLAYSASARALFDYAKNFHSKYMDKDHIGYVGAGSLRKWEQDYLVFITTLPVFDRLSSAKDCLLQHFAWSRKFENYKLEEYFKSPRKVIKFFSEASNRTVSTGAQCFMFWPEQLDRLVAIVQKTLPQKDPKEIVKDILENGHTESHRIIFENAIKKLNEEKNFIINENWTKAKSAIASFKIVRFIKLIWKNLTLRNDTRNFEKCLKKANARFHTALGSEMTGFDMVSSQCQIKGPFANPFLKN